VITANQAKIYSFLLSLVLAANVCLFTMTCDHAAHHGREPPGDARSHCAIVSTCAIKPS
jgi:hypothetical protein